MGCGKDIRKGWVNIDRKPAPGIDIVMDLDDCWPIKTDTADYILFDNVFEHLENPILALYETERVLKSSGKTKITVPHFKSPSSARPDHKTFWSKTSLNPWLKNRREKAGGLMGESLFILEDINITHHHPFGWHQREYLGREIIGWKPHNITFLLSPIK